MSRMARVWKFEVLQHMESERDWSDSLQSNRFCHGLFSTRPMDFKVFACPIRFVVLFVIVSFFRTVKAIRYIYYFPSPDNIVVKYWQRASACWLSEHHHLIPNPSVVKLILSLFLEKRISFRTSFILFLTLHFILRIWKLENLPIRRLFIRSTNVIWEWIVRGNFRALTVNSDNREQLQPSFSLSSFISAFFQVLLWRTPFINSSLIHELSTR